MPRLASFPYVVVRLACSRCPRRGQYCLARLAAKYGADIELVDLLASLAGSCPKWGATRPGIERCGAFFLDLAGEPLPDAPAPVAARLRVAK